METFDLLVSLFLTVTMIAWLVIRMVEYVSHAVMTR